MSTDTEEYANKPPFYHNDIFFFGQIKQQKTENRSKSIKRPMSNRLYNSVFI